MTDTEKNKTIIKSLKQIRDGVLRDLIRAECDLAAAKAQAAVVKSYEDRQGYGNVGCFDTSITAIELCKNRAKQKKDLLKNWDEVLTYAIEKFI